MAEPVSPGPVMLSRLVPELKGAGGVCMCAPCTDTERPLASAVTVQLQCTFCMRLFSGQTCPGSLSLSSTCGRSYGNLCCQLSDKLMLPYDWFIWVDAGVSQS